LSDQQRLSDYHAPLNTTSLYDHEVMAMGLQDNKQPY